MVFAQTMIDKGLVSTEIKIREAFEGVIRFIEAYVIRQGLDELPLVFFLKMIMSKIELVLTQSLPRHTKNFFNVLRDFLPKYFIKTNSG